MENLLSFHLELGGSGGLLPPVEDEQLLEPVQKFAADFLFLGALPGAVNGQDVLRNNCIFIVPAASARYGRIVTTAIRRCH